MKEGVQAIEAWTIYRDMGPQRTLDKTAQALGKNVNLIKRWSAVHKWGDRLRAYQRELSTESAKRSSEARLAEIEECQEERKIVARTLRAKAMRYFANKELEEEYDPISGKRTKKALDVTRAQLAIKMLEHADKTERLDLGEATERSETTTFDWASLLEDDDD